MNLMDMMKMQTKMTLATLHHMHIRHITGPEHTFPSVLAEHFFFSIPQYFFFPEPEKKVCTEFKLKSRHKSS
jgi:hypothetical protein